MGRGAVAFGRKAHANFAGSLVWGDSTNAVISDSAANQYRVRSSGGAWFYSNPTLTEGVYLPAGTSRWLPVDPNDSTSNGNGD
ncbi:MAG: hypothetical protein IPP40_07325 [bacterium]|nr:hypothetical protein [bacterium]